MTVEEKAQQVVEKFCEDEKELRGPDGKQPVSFVAYSSRLRQRVNEALRDQVEDCASLCSAEAERLSALATEYTQKGDLTHARNLSASAVTAGKNARDIRALAAPGEGETEEKGVER